MIRKLIPAGIKLRYRVYKRIKNDHRTGMMQKFISEPEILNENWPERISYSQPISQNSYTEAKLNNLRIALKALDGLILPPEKIFSYWQFIPRPVKRNGFQPGRNLVGGKLSLDYGGGLCQLSGVIYHVLLKAGFDIVERHAHSFDLYDENTRYYPLGSDATVVYGYKDLRMVNPHDFPVAMKFKLEQDGITAYLLSEQELQEHELDFRVEAKDGYKQATALRGSEGQLEELYTDKYKNYSGEPLE